MILLLSLVFIALPVTILYIALSIQDWFRQRRLDKLRALLPEHGRRQNWGLPSPWTVDDYCALIGVIFFIFVLLPMFLR
jgi:hypothetical protein